MTHTEKYELPIIEGTDVIDYAPFNEGMEKIEDAIEHNETLVQEAVDDVAEMGDTLNQKVQEVNQALEQTEQDVNASLEQTTTDLNNEVDSKLNRISKFVLARQYTIPGETYLFGSESGTINFPLTEVTPSISRIADVTTPSNNRFYIPMASQAANPVSKIDFECTVEPTAINETYNGACNTRIEVLKDRPGLGSEVVASAYVNTSVKTTIKLSGLATSSGGTAFRVTLASDYSHQIVGAASLTVENIGINN